MKRIRKKHTSALKLLAAGLMLTASVAASGQTAMPADSLPQAAAKVDTTVAVEPKDTALIVLQEDSVARMTIARADSMMANDVMAMESERSIMIDSTRVVKQKRDWKKWRPNPQRALWLALILPGGGQIYNRKYWKLPIVYGGIMGCLYAMNWNNMMYKDYSQAYLDLMDSDPTTQSYNQFLHLSQTITSANEERYKTIFKNRKDKYRRWRDLSFFCLLGVYALSVIDAYVDAELSEFDISKDLSLKVEPAVINNSASNNILGASSVGVHCSLKF